MKNLIILTAIFLFTANTAIAQKRPSVVNTSVSNKSLGQEQLNKKNYREARNFFAACIQENEQADDCYVGRGNANVGLGEIGYARANFAKALKINPKNKEASTGLANNPDDTDAPIITTEGLKKQKKLTDEDRKILNNVNKAQEEVHKATKTIK